MLSTKPWWQRLRGCRLAWPVADYCELYDTTLKGWTRVTKEAQADRGSPRLEVLWINPAATRAGAGRSLLQAAE